MKLRHLILFFVACSSLILSGFPGSSLIGLFAWLQINTLMTQPLFTKKSQMWVTYLFLISIPLVLFWGACHSFQIIYFNEQSWIFFIMALLVSFLLSCLAAIYFVLTFNQAEKVDYQIIQSLDKALKSIKDNRKYFLKVSCLIFTMSLIPVLAADWKIVFAIMATHLILNRRQLKQAFDSGL